MSSYSYILGAEVLKEDALLSYLKLSDSTSAEEKMSLIVQDANKGFRENRSSVLHVSNIFRGITVVK